MQRAPWLLAALVVGCLPRAVHADPDAPNACPDLGAYRNSLFIHHRWETTACMDDGSADCAQERAAVAQLQQMMQACLAGQNVGPPPTHFAPPPGAANRVRTTGFVEGEVGGVTAIASNDWKSSTRLSPAVAIRAGGVHGHYGAALAGEWIPERLTSPSVILPFGTNERSLNRFRFLADALVENRILPWFTMDGRIGLGVDVAFVTFSHIVGGIHSNDSANDVGLAAEAGADAWVTVGDGIDLGASLTLPYAHHGSQGTATTAGFSYDSLDLELTFGVRIRAASSGYSR